MQCHYCYLCSGSGQSAETAKETLRCLSRFYDCLEVEGGAEVGDLGVLAKVYYAKVLRWMQATQLLAPRLPWSRDMQAAISHYALYKVEEATQSLMPKTASANLIAASIAATTAH